MQEDDDDDDNNVDDGNNHDDHSYNSVKLQARPIRFCMEVHLDNTYTMMMIKMTILMIMMTESPTQSIFKFCMELDLHNI